MLMVSTTTPPPAATTVHHPHLTPSPHPSPLLPQISSSPLPTCPDVFTTQPPPPPFAAAAAAVDRVAAVVKLKRMTAT